MLSFWFRQKLIKGLPELPYFDSEASRWVQGSRVCHLLFANPRRDFLSSLPSLPSVLFHALHQAPPPHSCHPRFPGPPWPAWSLGLIRHLWSRTHVRAQLSRPAVTPTIAVSPLFASKGQEPLRLSQGCRLRARPAPCHVLGASLESAEMLTG